ncbi:zinc finger protein 287 [Clonorchis sinensis]|uniref:Zinc finger protein 287 n=1 Tax=Clonorchis sinensis TaxID=79923 RepID=G7YR87_CLOSI|nr:zinc finger protein 287 [Clonorchis sinensis]
MSQVQDFGAKILKRLLSSGGILCDEARAEGRSSDDKGTAAFHVSQGFCSSSTRFWQPGSIPVVVLPSGGMAPMHRRGATAERFCFILHLRRRSERSHMITIFGWHVSVATLLVVQHRPTARIVVSRGTRSGRNTAYHEDRSDYSRLGLQNASGCAIGNPKNLRDLEYAKIPELATVLVSEKRESLWDICKTEPKMSDSQDRHQWQYKSLARRPMCTFCGKVLDSPSRLRDHLLKHIGTKTEKCDVCGLEFKYRRSCQSHKLKQHQPGTLPPNRFRCDLCERSYRFISHLEAHRRSHFPTKEYQCVTCGEKLKYKSSLIRHEQDHHSGHICKICQSRFPSGKLLKRHSLEHKGAPCFPCTLCGKIYTRSIRLRQHLKQAHQDWSVSADSSKPNTDQHD